MNYLCTHMNYLATHMNYLATHMNYLGILYTKIMLREIHSRHKLWPT